MLYFRWQISFHRLAKNFPKDKLTAGESLNIRCSENCEKWATFPPTFCLSIKSVPVATLISPRTSLINLFCTFRVFLYYPSFLHFFSIFLSRSTINEFLFAFCPWNGGNRAIYIFYFTKLHTYFVPSVSRCRTTFQVKIWISFGRHCTWSDCAVYRETFSHGCVRELCEICVTHVRNKTLWN